MAQDPILRKLALYQSKEQSYFLLVGRNRERTQYRAVKFDRVKQGQQIAVTADPRTYSTQECTELLARAPGGDAEATGLTKVLKADALLGCFRLLQGWYLLLVTRKRLVGNICGKKIYGIADIRLVSLAVPSGTSFAGDNGVEKRYRKVLSGVELTKNFFFSFTYPAWRTVQANLTATAAAQPSAFDSPFVWNEYLTRSLREALGGAAGIWVMPLVHGFWQQRSLAVLGQTLTLTVFARRSKYFAGTRYRKRGINDQGHVANDVEIEQIVSTGFDWRTGYPQISSLVQVRGSIPLYWMQDTTVRKLKPDILLQHFDPLFQATRLHFEDLRARYGDPIVVLNLVKSVEKRPRETILRQEYASAISYINNQAGDASGEPIRYIPWDFNFFAKQRSTPILGHMAPVSRTCLEATGFFVCPPASPSILATRRDDSNWEPEMRLQRGVVRTNCIDCLDRTNVAQLAVGLHGLGHQLQALGTSDLPHLDSRSGIASNLMQLYELMGDVLARQYGGSEAHSTVLQQERGDWGAATSLRDKVTSLRRFYSNRVTDAEKQDALNLFLGNFVPTPGQPALWDLETDYYLHTIHSGLVQHYSRPSLLPRTSPTSPRLPPVARSLSADSGCITAAVKEVEQLANKSDDEQAPTCHAATVANVEDDSAKGEAPKASLRTMPLSEESVKRRESPFQAARPNKEGLPGSGETPRHAAAGILQYRAPLGARHSAKLESFDRKIGRRPNAIQEVRLDASAPSTSSYLPQWLSSPLGMRRSTPGTTTPIEASPSTSEGIEVTPGNPFVTARCGSLGGAAPLSAPPFRRSADDPHTRSPPPILEPLSRSFSESWNVISAMLSETLQNAQMSVLHMPMATTPLPSSTTAEDLASPPLCYHPATIFGPADVEGAFQKLPTGRLTFSETLSPSGARKLAPTATSSMKRTFSLPAKPASGSKPLGGKQQSPTVALPERAATQPELGLSHALSPWWTWQAVPGPAYWQEEQLTRSAYSKFLRSVEDQLQESQSRQLEAAYHKLCNPSMPPPGAATKAWRQEAGLLGSSTCSENVLLSLAAESVPAIA